MTAFAVPKTSSEKRSTEPCGGDVCDCGGDDSDCDVCAKTSSENKSKPGAAVVAVAAAAAASLPNTSSEKRFIAALPPPIAPPPVVEEAALSNTFSENRSDDPDADVAAAPKTFSEKRERERPSSVWSAVVLGATTFSSAPGVSLSLGSPPCSSIVDHAESSTESKASGGRRGSRFGLYLLAALTFALAPPPPPPPPSPAPAPLNIEARS